MIYAAIVWFISMVLLMIIIDWKSAIVLFILFSVVLLVDLFMIMIFILPYKKNFIDYFVNFVTFLMGNKTE